MSNDRSVMLAKLETLKGGYIDDFNLDSELETLLYIDKKMMNLLMTNLKMNSGK